MFIENFYKFIKYYGKGRKTRITGFFMLSLLAGFLEFVGIALIYPFIMLIVQPESVINTQYYRRFSSFMRVDDPLVNAFIFGFIVVFLFIVKNLFMIFSLYLQNKFSNNWKMDVNKKFMEYYLFSSYKNSLKTSAAEKIYNLTFLTSQALDSFVFRGINLVTNSVIIIMILALLFVKFPVAAVVTSVFVIFSMAIQNKIFKKRTVALSKKLYSDAMQNNNKIIECINNLKELKILSAEKYFYNDYLSNQAELNQLMIKCGFYNVIPPYIIEILIVLALLVLAGIISIQNVDNPSGMVASYAIVAAAIFRIAPALNRIQTAINAMNSSRDFVKALISEYENNNFNNVEDKSGLKIEFNERIELKDVNFSYNKGRSIIKDLNLELNKGEFVGIIGLSGAGKSTLADILMGLLPVDCGEVLVDGIGIDENNFSAMRKLIGYVPQQVNVLDASFRQNIAWGVAPGMIDDEKVVKSLKMARLLDFVEGFQDGINSNVIVGSNGLSQGQKQRLAIARALYRDSQILIFDEATSALDVETEHEITKMLSKLKGKKTIVAIAHRLSTLKSCDRLIYLKNGTVVDTGTFKELSKRHAGFEKLIKLSILDNA